jgi:hypothetical protein
MWQLLNASEKITEQEMKYEDIQGELNTEVGSSGNVTET